jgi:transcription elongation factor Elf1
VTSEALDNWTEELDEVKAAINRRFSNMKCLRCGNEAFGLRIFADDTLKIIETTKRGNQLAEFICSSCGMIERHYISYLIQKTDDGSNG